MNSHTASIWSLVNLLIILLLSKDVLPLHMKAIHNKDYSVVKTFKAGLIRASLSVYKKTIRRRSVLRTVLSQGVCCDCQQKEAVLSSLTEPRLCK